MCNNFHTSGRGIRDLAAKLHLQPHDDVALQVWPSRRVPVAVVRHDEPPGFDEIPWGLRVPWQKQLILFARGETVHQKPTFRDAFASGRCLVPASCFEETQWFGRADGSPLIFGGVIEGWYDLAADDFLTGFALVSTQASGVVMPHNDRQPLILPESAWETWLDPAADLRDVRQVIQTCHELAAVDPPVSKSEPRRRGQAPANPDQLELNW